MFLRLGLAILLMSPVLLADQECPIAHFCAPRVTGLSPKQVKSLLDKTARIQAPCCAHMLHIRGKIVLAISVDTDGGVACIVLISGNALIVGPAIDSVRNWKFRPYIEGGQRRPFCGTTSIRYDATEYRVKYAVV